VGCRGRIEEGKAAGVGLQEKDRPSGKETQWVGGVIGGKAGLDWKAG